MMLEVILAMQLVWSDGDSGSLNGERFRLHGIDAPETYKPDCEMEKVIGDAALLEVSVSERVGKVEIVERYGVDQYGRQVVDMTVGGVVDIADRLVRRGLAKTWDYDGGEPKPDWCTSGLYWTTGTQGFYKGLKFRLAQVYAPAAEHAECAEDAEWGDLALRYARQYSEADIAVAGFHGMDDEGFAILNMGTQAADPINAFMVDEGIAEVWDFQGTPPTRCK